MKILKALPLLTLIVCSYLLMAYNEPTEEEAMARRIQEPTEEEAIARRIQNMHGLRPSTPGEPLYDSEMDIILAQPAEYLAAIDQLNELSNRNPDLFGQYIQFIRNYMENFMHTVVPPTPLPLDMQNQLHAYTAIPNNMINAQNSSLILHIIDNGNFSL